MFNTKPKISKMEEIEQRSEGAIAVFKSTLETLVDIESDVSQEIESKKAEIHSIEAKIISLNERKAKNDKFVNKLKEFFE